MISGKSFMKCCQWVLDIRYPEERRFNIADAKNGDWVFINGDQLNQFRSMISLPFFLTKRFNIIIHNSDLPFRQQELEMILPLSKQIYAINTTVFHPRLRTIPLGFPDRDLETIQEFKKPDVPRDIEIYVNFKIKHNVDKRLNCYNAVKDNPNVVIKNEIPLEEYYIDLCRSKFVLCPEGTGIDTHRLYEALYFGATPVVLRNSLSHIYEKLPVCIVEKWTDKYYIPSGKTFNTNINQFFVE
jgi:hypothetical protein